ncbi:transcriptional regulator [Palaeococcus pacificus DY20341]|uniref:Transcriptional regulator n=1 Tax=Palaeococcus pacificus DY20341 TaxID=1343739 RepID=A0A075LT61_9EURY|nr:transcriptional regulator [Palaeococcus pacificus]AIF69127.1 transcriptional regulator [Palaeococcus pacificus DY20341]
MMTRRQKIIKLLEERDYSVSELALLLDMRGRGSGKIILEDLRAIARALKREGKVLLIQPAQCKNCGFVFKSEIKIPSKCPKCRSSWIEEPRFKISVK